MEITRVGISLHSAASFVRNPYVQMVVGIALAALALVAALYVYVRRNYASRIEFRPPQEVYHAPVIVPSQDWPQPLIAAVGGQEKFDALPTLKATGLHLQTIVHGLNPYIVFQHDQVPQDVMKVEDPFGRKGLCWVQQAKATDELSVSIIFLRDPAQGRWYFDNSRSAINQDVNGLIPFPKGDELRYLERLIAGEHPNYKLRNAAS